MEIKPVLNYQGREDVLNAFHDYDADRLNAVTVGSLYHLAQKKGWIHPNNRNLELPSNLNSTDLQDHINHEKGKSENMFDLSDGKITVSNTPPEKRDYVFADTVTKGSVCIIAGTGGASKTAFVIQLALAASEGKPIGNLQVKKGSSLLFLGEEDLAERDRRAGAMCSHFKFNANNVTERVRAFPAAGIDIRLTTMIHGSLTHSNVASEIIRLSKEHYIESDLGVELIVIDHARLSMDGDPNDAAHVTQLTRVLTHIAQETGAAVVLLAHSPKNVNTKSADEISAADVAGSSAFVDNARSAFMMYGMRDGDAKKYKISEEQRSQYVKLECVKANYAATGTIWWFKRVTLDDWQTAVLEPVTLNQVIFSPGQVKQKLRGRLIEFVQNHPGQSRRQLRSKSGQEREFKASEKDVISAVDDLLQEGLLTLRKPTPEEITRLRVSRARELLFVR